MGGPSSKTLNTPAKRKQSYRNYEPNMLVSTLTTWYIFCRLKNSYLLTEGPKESQTIHWTINNSTIYKYWNCIMHLS